MTQFLLRLNIPYTIPMQYLPWYANVESKLIYSSYNPWHILVDAFVFIFNEVRLKSVFHKGAYFVLLIITLTEYLGIARYMYTVDINE